MAGRVCTQVMEEEPCFCGLGPQGCLICVATLPIGIYHPIAGFGIFCCLSNYLREKVVQKYNVEEEQCCCCGSWNYPINYCHFGCNYPVISSYSFLFSFLFLRNWLCSISALCFRCICLSNSGRKRNEWVQLLWQVWSSLSRSWPPMLCIFRNNSLENPSQYTWWFFFRRNSKIQRVFFSLVLVLVLLLLVALIELFHLSASISLCRPLSLLF